jgi:hypothetical protein
MKLVENLNRLFTPSSHLDLTTFASVTPNEGEGRVRRSMVENEVTIALVSKPDEKVLRCMAMD